jgi:N-acetylmuramoyl-L-alanine amidase
MGFFRHGGLGRGCGWLGAVAWVGLCCGGAGSAQTRTKAAQKSPWDAAVEARTRFEAEAAGTHTKVEYAAVMDGFRAIYHGDPSDPHAARAVEQVAELLVEQGTELKDQKSLKDAAGQYEFLAKAYPAYSQAEKKRLAAAKLGGDEVVRRAATNAEAVPNTGVSPLRPQKAAVSGRDDSVVMTTKKVRVGSMVAEEAVAASGDKVDVPVVPMAVVTGIRHWSTATYTRVAIDLSVEGDGEVKYEAARVEHPDRLFFDLHHAKLAAGLAGRSFSIADDGFLTRIRAAQAGEDVTRVVLDVHAVAEYSAFLLPNPMRLIIDIHGKQEIGNRKQEVAEEPGVATTASRERSPGTPVGNREQGIANTERRAETSTPDTVLEEAVAPIVPAPAVTPVVSESAVSASALPAPVAKRSASGAVEVSSLPPMPVTDGSAGFGLPVRGAGMAKTAAVAQPPVAQPVPEPRVVIPSKPTVAKPVPNTVVKTSSATGSEVAAVSEQPGKVLATTKPTSQPVSSGSNGATSDHYVPRSKRKPIVAAEDAVPATVPASDAATPAVSAADSAVVVAPTPKKRHGAKGAVVGAAPVEAAPPTADGETSLVRALGLKIGRIVIDAGHGGHDSGTLGAGGIQEKDVVLDVALRLGKLLHDRLGAEIVYTRADDTFVPLETRTAIANKAQADLFISVHANSSPEPSARGVEVYYLNFTSDPEAMTVASRENAVSTQSVHELSDLVKKIALKDKIEESKELAGDVDASLYAGLTKGNEGLKDRGVKKAPFVVLIGANMPSILAEISFVTNPDDAEQLQTPEYRERVAESLYGGVAKYAAGINAGKAKVKAVERAER